jgi:hypothetical protein
MIVSNWMDLKVTALSAAPHCCLMLTVIKNEFKNGKVSPYSSNIMAD